MERSRVKNSVTSKARESSFSQEGEKMMKRTLAIIALTAAFSIGMIHQAMAAKSLMKAYKVSVTLPEMVGVTPQDLSSKAKVKSYTLSDPRKHTEETVIVRNNEEILLRTTVVQ